MTKELSNIDKGIIKLQKERQAKKVQANIKRNMAKSRKHNYPKNRRRGPGFASKRDNIREYIKREQRPCELCGKPIDYDLPAGHPGAFELDERLPVSKGGSPIEYSNLAATHRYCNQLKGNRCITSFADLVDKKKVDNNKRMKLGKIENSNDWLN